ncbi:glycosyltransferase family 4 protein [Actinoplanes sp. NBRC 103695]|uniref:glycosyltransferase family 4 protein n=1 Tax=Actinoplanes sp. NBRC 103695 TaxID=3032202 RepID=UPI0024A41E61|nr:glycosyltransferase family 4 protein [Actinoplanes sp. NBRC 103695]GLY97957.1 glycosyl transferase [Actinoplanes sp. NBRC 103695]
MSGRFFVMPGGVDDPARPSGGNRYDRAVSDRLTNVHEIAVPGSWPRPAPRSVDALAAALGGIPEMSQVVIDGLVGCGVPEVIERAASRLRVIMLVHLPLGDESAEAADLVPLERRALHAAAGIVVTSDQAAARVIALHGLPADKVSVAAPGVDLAPVAEPSPGGGRFLCVAAISHRKGQDVLLSALSALEDPPWTCTFVGAGTPPATAMRGVVFAGPLGGAELDAAYGAADLLVLPSRAETYGMVVTEALARGLPVVGTQVDGVPEALGAAPDGTVPGVLVPPGDPEALAVALREWLGDARLRERWRAAARARRETLRGWDETTRLLDEVLRG